MKRSIIALAVALFSAAQIFAADTFQADKSSTVIGWKGEKVTGEHTGTIQLANGSLTVDGGELKGGSFEIDMTSIKCTDLTDASTNQKLVGHLKSDDFFSVDKNPKAKFVITKATKKSATKYTITGNLTIKGITKEVTFPAEVYISGTSVNATAKITIDRSQFDIRFGSGSFFDNLGDKMIYDNFYLDLRLIAKK